MLAPQLPAGTVFRRVPEHRPATGLETDGAVSSFCGWDVGGVQRCTVRSRLGDNLDARQMKPRTVIPYLYLIPIAMALTQSPALTASAPPAVFANGTVNAASFAPDLFDVIA